MPGCSIRAVWVLNNAGDVVFSRRFPVVERQWRIACKKEEQKLDEGKLVSSLSSRLPTDGEITQGFIDRKQRDGSVSGYGIRIASSQKGSDSWVDDPITRHVISLQLDQNVESAPPILLWPLVLHIKGQYRILVLPLVEPYHLMMYEKICQRDDCGNPNEVKKNSFPGESLSSLLLDLPCITGFPSSFLAVLCRACLLILKQLHCILLQKRHVRFQHRFCQETIFYGIPWGDIHMQLRQRCNYYGLYCFWCPSCTYNLGG